MLHLEYTCPENIELVTGLITSSTLALNLGMMLKVKTMTSSDDMCEWGKQKLRAFLPSVCRVELTVSGLAAILAEIHEVKAKHVEYSNLVWSWPPWWDFLTNLWCLINGIKLVYQWWNLVSLAQRAYYSLCRLICTKLCSVTSFQHSKEFQSFFKRWIFCHYLRP